MTDSDQWIRPIRAKYCAECEGGGRPTCILLETTLSRLVYGFVGSEEWRKSAGQCCRAWRDTPPPFERAEVRLLLLMYFFSGVKWLILVISYFIFDLLILSLFLSLALQVVKAALIQTLKMLGPHSWLLVACVSREWRKAYLVVTEGLCMTSKEQSLSSVSVLNYCREMGLGMDYNLEYIAGRMATVDVSLLLMQLHGSNGYYICNGAAEAGRLRLLRQLCDNYGCTFSGGAAEYYATKAPLPCVLQWLHERGGDMNWSDTRLSNMIRWAAENGRVENAMWLRRELKAPWHDWTCYCGKSHAGSRMSHF